MSRPLLFHCPHVAEPWASPLAQSLPCQVLMWFLPRAQGPGAAVLISGFQEAFQGLCSRCPSHSGRQGAEVARLRGERAGYSDAPLPSQARCQQAAVGGGGYFCLRSPKKTSAWRTCFQAHIPSICPGGSPCDPLTGLGLMRNNRMPCQLQLLSFTIGEVQTQGTVLCARNPFTTTY